ncbi:hypothetical protein, partial [Streptomyces sp. NPDC060205]|uniref:hypothetical protein n=1 Tax=Streptomyces sp. NPDC060205 TaxID=3347072 RepID=UPI003654C08A
TATRPAAPVRDPARRTAHEEGLVKRRARKKEGRQIVVAVVSMRAMNIFSFSGLGESFAQGEC